MADKKGRVQEIIQRNLSEIIIYGLKSELTQFASINQVKMTPDYSYCTIYVSHIDSAKSDALVNFLNKRAPFIRSQLASKISIYKTPELKFVKDELFEKGKKMEDLISKALKSKPKTLKDLDKEEKSAKKTIKKATVSKKTTMKSTAKKTFDSKKSVKAK